MYPGMTKRPKVTEGIDREERVIVACPDNVCVGEYVEPG